MAKTETAKKEEKTKDLVAKIEKLEDQFIAQKSDSKLETQKKSRALREIRKEIARAKTLINEKIYEEAQNE
jgi:ribosomal protein L29